MIAQYSVIVPKLTRPRHTQHRGTTTCRLQRSLFSSRMPNNYRMLIDEELGSHVPLNGNSTPDSLRFPHFLPKSALLLDAVIKKKTLSPEPFGHRLHKPCLMVCAKITNTGEVSSW
ncbi:hypothetical protein VTI28DRAFT_6766 [Corynascus sepedonium]